MILISSSNNDLAVPLDDICRELERSTRLHPDYPASYVRRAMIMIEEAGEVAKASLEVTRPTDPPEPLHFKGIPIPFDGVSNLYAELVQTAAMCLKFMVAIRKESM